MSDKWEVPLIGFTIIGCLLLFIGALSVSSYITQEQIIQCYETVKDKSVSDMILLCKGV